MTGPAKALVAALREQPLTLAELAARLQYPIDRTLGFLTEARAAGYVIHARRDPAIASVPARAQPEAGALTTVFEVESTRR